MAIVLKNDRNTLLTRCELFIFYKLLLMRTWIISSCFWEVICTWGEGIINIISNQVWFLVSFYLDVFVRPFIIYISTLPEHSRISFLKNLLLILLQMSPFLLSAVLTSIQLQPSFPLAVTTSVSVSVCYACMFFGAVVLPSLSPLTAVILFHASTPLFLDSTCKGDHLVFVFLWLAYFI